MAAFVRKVLPWAVIAVFIFAAQLAGASTNFSVPPESATNPNDITVGPDNNLWFTELTGGRIGRMTPAGTITEFPVSNAVVLQQIVSAGGALWFTDSFSFANPYIGTITTAGVVTKFPVNHAGTGLTFGPGNALWIASQDGYVSRFDLTTHVVTDFAVPGGANPYRIATGPDGNLWFTSEQVTVVGRMTPAGQVTLYRVPSGGLAFDITSDGTNLWFTEGNFCGTVSSANAQCVNIVAKITPAGVITEFQLNDTPGDITKGPDGRLWFHEQSSAGGSTAHIGAIDPATGNINEYLSKQGTFARLGGRRGIVSGPGGQLWLLGGAAAIGSMNTSGVVTNAFPVPSSILPIFITNGSDGNLWFTTQQRGNTGQTSGTARITPTGTITFFPSGCSPEHITSGSDGNLWYADDCGQIGQVITSTGASTTFPINNGGNGACDPFGIASGSDGNLWVTDACAPFIYQFTTTGVETDFPLPGGSTPFGIVAGPDGNLWYADPGTNSIGKITTGGGVALFPLPSPGEQPYAITVGPDNNLWFTNQGDGTVGKITTTGTITIYQPPALKTFFSFIGCGQDITSGPDGNLWVGTFQLCIGQTQDLYSISTSGVVNMMTGPNLPANPSAGVVTGPDNKLWLTGQESATISRMSAISGTFTVTPSINPTPTSVSANATFNDGTPTAQATDFTATINWGDGNTTPATVSGSTGTFNVLATHPYSQVGNFTVTVALHDTVDNQDYPLTATAAFGQTTNTAIYSSENPAVIGSIVTFTARVTSVTGSMPTGTVSFFDNGSTLLGTVSLDPQGYASFSTSAITVSPANHSITAVYNGNATLLGSTSPALKESVQDNGGNPFLFGDNHLNFGTGTAAVDAVIADFNGDGILDFASADASTSTVGIFLGDGTGNFIAGPVYSMPAPPQNVAVGDFNRDGKLDLVVTLAIPGPNNVGILIGNGDGTFVPGAFNISSDNDPDSIAVADLNNDGRLDLAIANSGSSDISIFLGDGNGGFVPAAVNTFSYGGTPEQLLVADVNRDGKPDLIVSPNAAHGISVLLGNGDGTFQNPIPTADLLFPHRMAIADVNHDGKLDIIATDKATPELFVFLGNGNGTFGAPLSFPINDVSCYPAVGDIDHDGNLDVGMPCPSTNGGFLLGKGDGTFGPFLQIQGGGHMTPQPVSKILLADFNRDGLLDALVVNGNGDVTPSLFISHGPQEPSWSLQQSIVGTDPFDVTLGDFDRDGKLDLAFANQNPAAVDVMLNTGNGAFGAPVSNSVSGIATGVTGGDLNLDGKLDLIGLSNPSNVSQAAVLKGNGNGTFQVAVNFTGSATSINNVFGVLGDFNRDGKLDLAIANSSNNISVLLGNGDGTFQQPATTYPICACSASRITAGDFNGDGILDLAFGADDNSMNVMLGVGDGTFQTPLHTALSIPGGQPFGIVAADFNRDGKLDIGFTDASPANSFTVMLGNGDGTFQNPVGFAIPNAINPQGVTLLDANYDGKLDVAISDPGIDFVTLLEGNGDGSFRVAGSYPLVISGSHPAPFSIVSGDVNNDAVPDLVTADAFLPGVSVLLSNAKTSVSTNYSACQTPVAIALSDFNGDGVSDMAVVNAGCNNITIRLGNGDGSFQSSSGSYAVGSNPSAIAAADFNKDGKADLAVANKGSNTISILLGNGDGTFTPAAIPTLTTGNSPSAVTIGDVNADGKIDLMVVNAIDGTLQVFLGKGDGSFQTPIQFSMGKAFKLAASLNNPNAMAIADLNGDGKLDLAIVNSATGQVAVFINIGAGSFAVGVNYNVGPSPSSIAVADFNGDGKADIAVANKGNNTVTVLLNQGSGTFGGTAITLSTGSSPNSITALDYNNDGKPDIAVLNSGDNTIDIFQSNGNGTFQPPTVLSAGAGAAVLAAGNLTGGGLGDLVVANTPANSVSVLLNAAAVLLDSVTGANFTYGQVNLGVLVQPAVRSSRIPSGQIIFKEGANNLGSSHLDSSGQGTVALGRLDTGNHTITTSYSGDPFFNSNTATLSVNVGQASSVTVMTSSNSPSSVGQNIFLTAGVAVPGGLGLATGTVTFKDGGVTIGSAILDGSGHATLPISSLALGTHLISASYPGDKNVFASAATPITQTVIKASSVTSAQFSGIFVSYGQTLTVNASVTANPAPTGNMNFMDGDTLLASVPLAVNGSAQFSTNSLAVGQHFIQAVYAGNANLASSSSTGINVTVNQAATSLHVVSSKNPAVDSDVLNFTATVSPFFSGTPTGNVTFTADGNTPLGTAMVSGNNATIAHTLSVGTHRILASYNGDGNFFGSNHAVFEIVNNPGAAATTVTLVPSMTELHKGDTLTLNATVTSLTPGTIGGTVTFVDDDQVLGTAPVTAGGVASFQTKQLPIGHHPMFAIYNGDSTYGGNVANVVSGSPVPVDIYWSPKPKPR